MKFTPLRTLFAALLLAVSFSGSVFADDKNAKCPLMTDDDADPEYTVEYEGKQVILCCDKCAKHWKGNEKYVIKASLDLLPQFKDMAAKLGLDKVELLPQRFCPIKTHNLVTPDSPSVEYKGKKVYLWDKKAVEKWNKDPDGCAQKAIEAGLLPQLADAGKK
ncbi:MAG: hypothetical protein KA004_12815 [Verrucomicrobiales bacterium]|nr:hypothetical protein [Verrucomicrobiales bacterium]